MEQVPDTSLVAVRFAGSAPAGSALSHLDRWLEGAGRAPAPQPDRTASQSVQQQQQSGRTTGRQGFEVSLEDFDARVRGDGWDFCRGVIVGFLSGLPLTYAAVIDEPLLRLA
jgi:hypothetical protein